MYMLGRLLILYYHHNAVKRTQMNVEQIHVHVEVGPILEVY